MNKWSVLHYGEVFMIFCQMTACFSKPTRTKYRSGEYKVQKTCQRTFTFEFVQYKFRYRFSLNQTFTYSKQPKGKKIFVQVPLFRDNCVQKHRDFNTVMNVDALF